MNETKKASQINMIAGVLFGILALNRLSILFRVFSVWNFLSLVAFGAIAATLLIKRRDVFTVIGFGLCTLLSLRGIFLYGNKLLALLDLAAYGIITFMALGDLTNYVPDLKGKLDKLWFVPGICSAVSFFFSLIFIIFGRYLLSLSGMSGLLEAVGLFLAALWIAYPEGLPDTVPSFGGTAGSTPEAYASDSVIADNAYCGMAKHVLLLLFTFGIWNYIWVYRTTEHLNRVQDEPPRNPTTKLLLYMFVPFYSIYWIYKSALRVDKLAAAKGLSSDIATLCLILSIFVPIIPPILMQDKINTIVTSKGFGGGNAANAQSKSAGPGLGTAEELQRYKELLDNGTISQEEFDAMKKQLLGL